MHTETMTTAQLRTLAQGLFDQAQALRPAYRKALANRVADPRTEQRIGDEITQLERTGRQFWREAEDRDITGLFAALSTKIAATNIEPSMKREAVKRLSREFGLL